MKYPLLVSLFIHGSLLLFLLVFSGSDNHLKETSFVSLINMQNSQSSRLKKVKGSIENKSHIKKDEEEGVKKTSMTKGKDQEDVEARLSSNAANTKPAFMSYAQDLQMFIEKNQYYPRRALVMGQQGVVQIRFQISRNGTFSNIEVLEKAESEILNSAAFDLIVSLKSFKPLPKEYKGKGEFVVPIRYQIKAI